MSVIGADGRWHLEMRHYGTLHIEVTGACPLNCPCCYLDRAPVSDLSWDRLRHILNDAIAIGVLQVAFGGGEPLGYDHLEDAVELVARYGLGVSVTTSGLGANLAKLSRLRTVGLDHLQVSITEQASRDRTTLGRARSSGAGVPPRATADRARRRGILDPRVGIVLHTKRKLPRSAGVEEPLAARLLQATVAIDITLGPTFIFEYAMELVDAISRVFRDAEVTGGLDCATGWTWGCTYAASLYPFVALHPELPAQEVIARVFDSPLLQRPRLRGGYEKIDWYRLERLHAAVDINFAGGSKFLLNYLEAPEACGLAPSIEHFVDHDDQATRKQYVKFCCSLQAAPLTPAAKRDLSLVYLCLPEPDEVRDPWAKELLKAQVDLLRPLYAGAGRWSPEEISTLHQRLCWLGLNPEDATRAVVWVRPTVALFAKGVLERAVGAPVNGLDRLPS